MKRTRFEARTEGTPPVHMALAKASVHQENENGKSKAGAIKTRYVVKSHSMDLNLSLRFADTKGEERAFLAPGPNLVSVVLVGSSTFDVEDRDSRAHPGTRTNLLVSIEYERTSVTIR